MNIEKFQQKKSQQQKISMLTCYDYPSAKIISESNIDCVLVGDTVAMVVHGYHSTIMATIEMMVMHTLAVARGLGAQFLLADLPFLCHRSSIDITMQSVKQLLQAGAHAVKIEGGDANVCLTIEHLVMSGVPVVGHIGLTPQSVLKLGGFKVQGKTQQQAEQLLEQAYKLEAAGCSALVIECVPSALAKTITAAVKIPTIGIGAGADTDGQVLVWHDMLGLQTEYNFRFVKQFAQTKTTILAAINNYVQQVNSAVFPSDEHAY